MKFMNLIPVLKLQHSLSILKHILNKFSSITTSIIYVQTIYEEDTVVWVRFVFFLNEYAKDIYSEISTEFHKNKKWYTERSILILIIKAKVISLAIGVEV